MDPKDPSALATTLARTDTLIAYDPHTLESLDFLATRYERVALLGRGGMGEVRLCVDKLIGREIARKTILPESRNGASLARFVREAKVQARLEHPSIVPVYDIGRDEDGAVWFTMKRVRGRSLDDVIDAIARGDEATAADFSRRKLLGAFVAVCYAVAFAHERGVIHRDLKPNNIMLGSFGEVSVLDWGIAKVVGTTDPALADEALSDLAPRVHATEHGAAVGTPGYMSPEQARGESDVGPESDVYALGAILFEILAHARLHQGSSAIAVMLETTRGVDARPSVRGAADVPIELDEICAAATRLAPEERTPSARALAEAVEKYLDGDRDLARRRQLSAEHTDKATAAREGGVALLELGRALALDPSNERARDLLAQRLIAISDEVPPEAREELEEERARARRAASRAGAVRYASWCGFIPLLFWMGLRNVPLCATVIAFMAITGAWAWWMTRRAQRGSSSLLTLLVMSSITVALISGLCGPFILVPALAATNAMYFAMTVEARHRIWAIVASITAIAVPFSLQLAGVIPRSYELGASLSSFTVKAVGCDFPAIPTLAMLVATSMALAIVPVVLVGRMRDRLTHAEQRLFLQAWQLRATLPK